MINIIIYNKDFIETLELRDYIKYFLKKTNIANTVIEISKIKTINFTMDFEIIFIDIQLYNYEILKEINGKGILIILMSNYGLDALKGYEVNAFRFLQKPFKYNNLRIILKECLTCLRSQNIKILFKHKNKTNLIKLNQIYYIEKYKKKVLIYTKYKKILVKDNLKEIEQYLDDYNFFKINRGAIVNIFQVQEVIPAEKCIVINGAKKSVSKDKYTILIDILKEQNME